MPLVPVLPDLQAGDFVDADQLDGMFESIRSVVNTAGLLNDVARVVTVQHTYAAGLKAASIEEASPGGGVAFPHAVNFGGTVTGLSAGAIPQIPASKITEGTFPQGSYVFVANAALPLRVSRSDAAAGQFTLLQLDRNGVIAGYLGMDGSDNFVIRRGADSTVALTINRSSATLTIGGNSPNLIYGTGTPIFRHSANDASFVLTGGTGSGAGGSLVLFGGAHATLPSVVSIRQNGTDRARWEPDGTLRQLAGARIEGTTVPAVGAGLELAYVGGFSLVQAYDRGGAMYQPLRISGEEVQFFANGAQSARCTTAGIVGNLPNGSMIKLVTQTASPYVGWFSSADALISYVQHNHGDNHLDMVTLSNAQHIRLRVGTGMSCIITSAGVTAPSFFKST